MLRNKPNPWNDFHHKDKSVLECSDISDHKGQGYSVLFVRRLLATKISLPFLKMSSLFTQILHPYIALNPTLTKCILSLYTFQNSTNLSVSTFECCLTNHEFT